MFFFVCPGFFFPSFLWKINIHNFGGQNPSHFFISVLADRFSNKRVFCLFAAWICSGSDQLDTARGFLSPPASPLVHHRRQPGNTETSCKQIHGQKPENLSIFLYHFFQLRFKKINQIISKLIILTTAYALFLQRLIIPFHLTP